MKALLGLLGPLKLPLAAFFLGAVLIAGAYQTGVNAERKRGEAARLRLENATLRADLRLAAQAQESAIAKGEALALTERQLQEELDALRADLARRPESDRCPATEPDLDLMYGRP